mmetsp:Transcript_9020/g.22412  ORF Transcript_9020/g.22412 Transcript_9020/m.22412 type:complete len:100 (+) Transcript_9020:125-424(+)
MAAHESHSYILQIIDATLKSPKQVQRQKVKELLEDRKYYEYFQRVPLFGRRAMRLLMMDLDCDPDDRENLLSRFTVPPVPETPTTNAPVYAVPRLVITD